MYFWKTKPPSEMNKAVHKSTDRSPVDIPPLNGFGGWSYSFNRDIEKAGTKNLKAKIIVDLFIIEDMTGSTTHKVFTSTSHYEMPITEDVTEDDFFQLYRDAFQKMREAFLFFQKQTGMQPAPFNEITKQQVKKDLSDMVAWYYSP
jgi:hypothetical protein